MNKVIDSFSVQEEYIRIIFNNNTDKGKRKHPEKTWKDIYAHYDAFHRVANFLCDSCGFTKSIVPYDETTTKQLPSLWSDHRWGGNKHLRFEGNRHPAGFEFEFWYQDSRTGNKCGGKYDITRGEYVTAVERVVFRNAARKVSAFLVSLGYEDATEPDRKGRDFVMHDIQDLKRRHWGKWESYKDEPYHMNSNARDRDEKLIENGQVKYFRDWSGRLSYGEVYHNINNMWWVVVNEFSFTNMACFDLFDPTPEDFAVRRLVRDRITEAGRIRKKIGTKRYNEMLALGVKMTLQKENREQ